METKDPTFVLTTHEEFKARTHINDIKRTGEKDVFALGTSKGLFILKIDSYTHEITQLYRYFNDPENNINDIRSLSFVGKTYLLLSFIISTQILLFDYVKNKVNFHFETP
jgi:hypothetical protein